MFRKVADARRRRAAFALSADGWKTKGRTRRHYFAIFVHWLDPATNSFETVCVGAEQLRKTRDAKQYLACTEKILKGVGLELTDAIAAVSDHEPALRKAFRDGQVPTGRRRRNSTS